MKDQVDALVANGVPAACVNSTLSMDERRSVADGVRNGRIKLLYLSPERLMTAKTLNFLKEARPSFFAIDEAHCISDWGHDFRPEYRQLSVLKEEFPGVAIHAYTATATPRVREDIARQLRLDNLETLVGSFDRPNLVYRVLRRGDRLRQISEVIARHRDEAGIVYCIRRADVDEVCAALAAAGHAALPYHAGLPDDERRRNQDDFIRDRARIMVATVAFGMGIDKSDVRYVVHAGAPKSLEHYQQESGRAGRDGLAAECCLLYSPGDFMTWRRLLQGDGENAPAGATAMLAGIERFCSSAVCRRRSLLEHFGQAYEEENCGACDACLGELEYSDESLVIGQKILSCVLRLQERFGAGYTASVLAGSREQRILDQGHAELSTHGILSEHDRGAIRDWIEQLVEQQHLQRTGDDRYPVLEVTETGRSVLRGELTPQLLKPAPAAKRASKAETISWEGVDRGLFDDLRTLRRERAEQLGVPPFVLFSDAVLRDLARRRPSTLANLRKTHGIGEQKEKQYGELFLSRIAAYCQSNGLSMDENPPEDEALDVVAAVSDVKRRAFDMFLQGKSVDEVAQALGRAASTTRGYLTECIDLHGISDADPWVDAETFERIRAAQSADAGGSSQANLRGARRRRVLRFDSHRHGVPEEPAGRRVMQKSPRKEDRAI